MPRVARMKYDDDCGGWYHLYSRVAGAPDWYPLEDKECRRKLLELIKFYANAYCCRVAAFALMGNHYHLVLEFEAKRKMTREELHERALRMYPRSAKFIDLWSEVKWAQFEKRIFSVSEFMRNLQGAFGTWYNQKFNRRGRFWAERFKSTLLADRRAVLDCMLYVDLNGVRAGLTKRPEDFEGASIFFRDIKKDGWLMPLKEFFDEDEVNRQHVLRVYKGMLYYRGEVPTKSNQAFIDAKVTEQEEKGNFESKGVYGKKLRYFTDGLIIGSESLIRDKVKQLREEGFFQRRKHPIPQEKGRVFSLRHLRKPRYET